MRRVLLHVACLPILLAALSASVPAPVGAVPTDSPLAQVGVPPGYTIDLVAQVQWPAEIQCASDGRCFVASVHDSNDKERSGIWIIYPDKTKQRIYTGPSYGSIQHLGEKGLTGMALHPRFNEDDRIFFYWSIPDTNETTPTWTVISSIRSDGSGYRELWRFTPDAYTNIHVAGGMLTYSENGHDYLYVAVGNYDNNLWSQDLAIDQGKIHRFEIVGNSLQIPADNPFVNTPGAKPSIWASGFRNPFRIHRDKATGRVYVDENGRSCSDRVYILQKGGNYGWPAWDNCQPDPGFVQPVYEFVTTMGITDMEIYYGPIPGWNGKAFICGFNTVPLYMFTVTPNGGLTNRQSITNNGACVLALATRADGALLFSRQTQFGLDGQIFAVVPINPGPRISAALSADAAQPADSQRIHYTLDVSNLSFANNLTATLTLPNGLSYVSGSTFGGAIYVAPDQFTWTSALDNRRSLRAGFDAVASAVPGTMLTVTANIVDRYGQQTAASAAVTVAAGPPIEFSLSSKTPSIQSGQSITYQLSVRNRSVNDATFALTTTLPTSAQFVRHVFTGTTTYSGGLRAVLWQRVLKAGRLASTAIVISATQSTGRSIPLTSTLTAGSAITSTITRLLVDPYQTYFAFMLRASGGAAAPGSNYLLVPDGAPFGRYGSPPGSIDNLVGTGTCQFCHDVAGSSIYDAWASSAHGYAAIDPAFKAALYNASGQVKDIERWCTQCHQPSNWLSGHPLDAQDTTAIICSICHRAVDSESLASIDQQAIQRAQAMGVVPPRWKEIGGNGALIVDPNDVRRGTNFLNAGAPHNTAISSFQGGSALCGSCHSVYAPHLARDAVTGEFLPGAPNVAGGENPLFLQSTYPEWENSQYAAADTQCQDCHMPLSPGYVAEPSKGGQPRDVPAHNFAGGNLFILDIFEQTGQLGDTSAQRSAVTTMLSQAAAITTSLSGSTLSVGVTCLAGHKCPTGYEEGRAWILQVEQLDADGQRIACSGCWDDVKHTITGYDAQPGDTDYDPELTEFGVRFGVTGTHALNLGLQPGETFNLAINNTLVSDTRIPPCGWDAVAYADLGIAPTIPYSPGSCTAIAQYPIQPGAHLVVVRLLHWSHTTPYLEFLRDAGGSYGATLWDAWQDALAAGKGRPASIAAVARFVGVASNDLYLPSIIRGP